LAKDGRGPSEGSLREENFQPDEKVVRLDPGIISDVDSNSHHAMTSVDPTLSRAMRQISWAMVISCNVLSPREVRNNAP
jgi:hypothetical protein